MENVVAKRYLFFIEEQGVSELWSFSCFAINVTHRMKKYRDINAIKV